MPRSRRHKPPSCTVIVKLRKAADLEITTTAAHALEIIDGTTVIPPAQTTVRDLEGNILTREQLLRLKAIETSD